MFALQSTSAGSLTGGWTVGGSDIAGGARIGGYAGGQPAIATCSNGSIAVITLRVTCGTSGQLCMGSLVDDISSMDNVTPCQTFTCN